MPSIHDVIGLMRSQFGKPYEFAQPRDWTVPDPASFDCSGLIHWSCGQLGVTNLKRTSMDIHRQCITKRTLLGDVRTDPAVIARGVQTFGALLIRSVLADGVTPCDPEETPAVKGHIVISLGNGRVIEARGTGTLVGEFNANPRPPGGTTGHVWTAVGLLPGISYSSSPPPLPGDPHPRPGRPYLRRDGLGPPNYSGGDRRDWVRQVQSLLITSGDLQVPAPTGNYVTKTVAAVTQFQQRVKSNHDGSMIVDGECGPQTWGWLLYLTGRGNEE